MDSELKQKVLKTGRSIVGIVCKDGIVMAADKKATADHFVISKSAKKINKINDYLIFAGTGIASDIDFIGKLIAAELRVKELKSRKRPSVREGASLMGMIAYNNIRHPSMIPFIAGTLVAGLNEDGSFELYTIEPAGTVTKVEDFDANFSSGMPFILGLLEKEYKRDITAKEAVELAIDCIKASSQRDTGTGFGIDVWVITKEGISQVVEQEIKTEYVEKRK